VVGFAIAAVLLPACGEDAPTTEEWTAAAGEACSGSRLEEPLATVAERYQLALEASIKEQEKALDALTGADEAIAALSERYADLATAVEDHGMPSEREDPDRAVEALTNAADGARLAEDALGMGDEGSLVANLNDLFNAQRKFQVQARELGVQGCSLLSEEMREIIDDGDGDALRGILRRFGSDLAGEYSPSGAATTDEQQECIADEFRSEMTFPAILEMMLQANDEQPTVYLAQQADYLEMWERCAPGTIDALRQAIIDDGVAQGAPVDFAECVINAIFDEEGVAMFELEEDEFTRVADAKNERCARELGYVLQ
jgi:hypothetical protein